MGRFKTICKNNKYNDFGSHTGFQWHEKYYINLNVDEWYEFDDDCSQNINAVAGVKYYKILNFKGDPCEYRELSSPDGPEFYRNDKYGGEHNRFSIFFYTVEEMRDINIDNILDK